MQLVVVGAHLGDGRAVADHRHDPLVLVVERLARFAGVIGEDVLGRPPAGLEGDRAELRQVVAVVIGDVGDVTDRVHTGEALDGQVGLGRQPPGSSGGQADLADELGRLDATGPDDGAGADLRSVAQRHPVGRDLADPGRQAEDHALVLQLARRISVGLVGERGEDDGTVIDDVDAGALDVEVVEGVRDDVVEQVGERTRGLDAGRSGADDHEVERAVFDVRGVVVGGFEDLDQPGPQRLWRRRGCRAGGRAARRRASGRSWPATRPR